MLILTRKQGQSIIIGDNEIEIIVLNNYAKLGISAQANVAINRKEIFERIQMERNAMRSILEEEERYDNYA